MRLAGAGRGRLCAPPGGLRSTDPGWIEMPCGCSQQGLAAVPPELWALFPAGPGPGAAAALSGTGGCVARLSLRGQGRGQERLSLPQQGREAPLCPEGRSLCLCPLCGPSLQERGASGSFQGGSSNDSRVPSDLRPGVS